MKLTVVGSSSRGNCYILHNKFESLIIEAGCTITEILSAINFETSKVAACIVSHEHGDHSKCVSSLQAYGIKCCMSKGTFEGIKKVSEQNLHIVRGGEQFTVGRFVVLPFDTHHDCNEPLGYLISHPEIGVMLFAIDTCYLDYTFDGLTNVMIECNYYEPKLMENVDAGVVHPKVCNHIMRSHMSLQTCIKTLQANKLDKVNNIILMHLSKDNAIPSMFKNEVELATGKNVVVAEKGLTIDINEIPFRE